ncbi:hypothetical protein [Streptomyces sp. NPDC015130]|uniref:hypothetical protein n=1 Tax=Streptomyces sp. NPDC015130 TaxID=3364940 RepID=UPI003702AB39
MQPQQPYTPPPQQPPTPPAPPATAPSRSRTTVVLLSVVAGLVLGAGATGAVWALRADGVSADGSSAAADARAACRALAGFDEARYTERGAGGDIAVNRYSAAGTLSTAAAAGDARYKPLAEAVRRSQERHSRLFEFDAEAKKDLGEARTICEDL